MGAGHTVTALYEVTLVEGPGLAGSTELATVELRWLDPSHREPVERHATLTAGDLAASFEQAPVRLRQAVLVAAFAECLRGGPWSQQVTLDWLAEQSASLSLWLPQDERVDEFAGLVGIAARLADRTG